MVIKKREFEQSHFDTIVVVYEIHRHFNKDGIEIVTRKPIQPNALFKHYWLETCKEYHIICGMSEYKVIDNQLIRTFISKHHPLHNVNL
jgi:ubiquinone biosynthesis protein Coq4